MREIRENVGSGDNCFNAVFNHLSTGNQSSITSLTFDIRLCVTLKNWLVDVVSISVGSLMDNLIAQSSIVVDAMRDLLTVKHQKGTKI